MTKVGFFRGVVANAAIVAVAAGLLIIGSAGGALPAESADVIFRGSSESAVSLMVNVYWGTEYIEEMLDIFDRHGVKTTFFVGGSWVRDNEETFCKIAARGHEIGNHGFFHKDHAKLDERRGSEEISATHGLVKSVSGIEMDLFAPPSGSYNDLTVEVAAKLGYTTIMWSLDTVDWRDRDAAVIFNRATKNISGGDLVLMHPTAATVAALPGIIGAIEEKGLTVAPVSTVIGRL